MIVSIEHAREVYLQLVKEARSSSQPILILVSSDVDSLCATRILLNLLQSEFILFDLIVLSSYLELSEINESYLEHFQKVAGVEPRYVIMINCGATIDLEALLSLSDGSCVLIFDHHRPVHLNNLFIPDQIQIFDDGELLSMANDIWPSFKVVEQTINIDAQESDSAHESSDSDTFATPNDENSHTAQRVLKKKEKVKLKNQLSKAEDAIKSYYDQDDGIGISASCLLYSIASQLVKTTNDLLWSCIVGTASLFVSHAIAIERYNNEIDLLEKEVLRLNSSSSNSDIYLEEGVLNLSLFRHWTLYKSLMYSIHSASKFQTLSEKGKRRIEVFLARLGISLSEANQQYLFLESETRKRISLQLEKSFSEEGLTDPIISVFIRRLPSSSSVKVSAVDYVYAIQGLLWHPMLKNCKEKSTSIKNIIRNNFLLALGVFSGKNSHHVLDRGLKLAKVYLEKVHKTSSVLFSSRMIKTIKSFKLCILPNDYIYEKESKNINDSTSISNNGSTPLESIIDWWSNQSALASLASFLCEYCNVTSTTKKIPMLIAHQLPESGMFIVVGCAPKVNVTETKIAFGSAFRKAAIDSGARVRTDGIDDAWAIQIETKDLSRFMQRLQFYFPNCGIKIKK